MRHSADTSQWRRALAGGIVAICGAVTLLAPACLLAQVSADSVAAWIAQLDDNGPRVRAEAARRLIAEPAALRMQAVRAALVRLLERENEVIAGLAGRGTSSLGEGFSEYYSELIGVVATVGDLREERTMRAVALGSYNPDSPLARRIAHVAGARILPLAAAMFAGPSGSRRENGFSLAAHVYMRHGGRDLDSAAAAQVMAMFRRGAEDPLLFVRQQAVAALALVGTRDDIPMLQRVASADAYVIIHSTRGRVYPVREAAAAAIENIRGRRPQ